jgi:hypothetical protein
MKQTGRIYAGLMQHVTTLPYDPAKARRAAFDYFDRTGQ